MSLFELQSGMVQPRGFLFIWFLLISLLVSVLSYSRFARFHNDLPVGCDEFGYLQLAREFLGQEPSENPLVEELTAYLKGEGIEYREYGWMVAPHAYHLNATTEKRINQYPPGTSLLLLLIPESYRKKGFAFIVTFLLLIIPIILVLRYSHTPMSTSFLVLLTGVLMLFVPPFQTEFGRVNSVAPTYGFLIAAGLVFPSKPGLALLLVSLTIPFRLANVLVLFALFTGYFLFLKGYRSSIKRWAILLLASSPGIMGVLCYHFIKTGNPLNFTYSNIDQKSSGIEEFMSHLEFYIWQEPGWFWIHVIALAALIALSIKGLASRGTLLTMIWLIGLNYLFYFFHHVAVPYYPYASSMIIIGAALGRTPLDKLEHSRGYKIAGVISIILMVMTPILYERQPSREQAQIDTYSRCFNENEVVWSELRSGTIEYATGAIGFRYLWGSERARDLAIKWLNDKGITQKIWMEEFADAQDEILRKIEISGLNYTKEDFELGTLVLIPGYSE